MNARDLNFFNLILKQARKAGAFFSLKMSEICIFMRNTERFNFHVHKVMNHKVHRAGTTEIQVGTR